VNAPSFLRALFNPNATPEQKACGHLLSYQMKDGKHFCASCRLVSDVALRDGEDA